MQNKIMTQKDQWFAEVLYPVKLTLIKTKTQFFFPDLKSKCNKFKLYK